MKKQKHQSISFLTRIKNIYFILIDSKKRSRYDQRKVNSYKAFKFVHAHSMLYTFFSKKDKSVERESNIQKAISYYFSHEESIRVVAQRFEIHPSTFHGRLNGQHGPQIGRPSLLSVEMETTIKMLLMELNDFGYGYGKKNFLNMMNFHSKAHPELRLPTFGKKWVNGFQERHPEISLRIAGKTNTSRQVACQPKEMDFFFKEVEKLLTEKCITQPTHMFNCDESGMTFSEGNLINIIIHFKKTQFI